jgi:hypothetical protein
MPGYLALTLHALPHYLYHKQVNLKGVVPEHSNERRLLIAESTAPFHSSEFGPFQIKCFRNEIRTRQNEKIINPLRNE